MRLDLAHKGVFYDRYILGLWTVAEGLIFPHFAEEPAAYLLPADAPRKAYDKLVIGVDFGGHGSMTCFCLTGYTGYDKLTVLAEDGLPLGDAIDAQNICDRFIAFYKSAAKAYGRVNHVLCDSASPTLINSLVSAARTEGLPFRNIGSCVKNEVSQRPITIDRLLNTGRLFFAPHCRETVRSLSSLRWDEKHPDRPEDKNTGNINDRWDAFCYSWLDFSELIERR